MGEHQPYHLHCESCLGTSRGLGPRHRGLSSSAAKSSAPVSALGLDLALDRFSYSSSRGTSAFKAKVLNFSNKVK